MPDTHTSNFNVKLISASHAAILIVLMLAVFIGSVFLFIPHGIHDIRLTLVVVGGSMGIAYILWQKIVTGRTRWTVSDKEINIEWSKKFAFTECRAIVLRWEEVKNISKGLDPHYYNLKIQLVSGATIRFYHDYLTTGDDFQQCLIALNQTFGRKRQRIPRK